MPCRLLDKSAASRLTAQRLSLEGRRVLGVAGMKTQSPDSFSSCVTAGLQVLRSLIGPGLPTWALPRAASYLGYTVRVSTWTQRYGRGTSDQAARAVSPGNWKPAEAVKT
jgi:hypothetical protein